MEAPWFLLLKTRNERNAFNFLGKIPCTETLVIIISFSYAKFNSFIIADLCIILLIIVHKAKQSKAKLCSFFQYWQYAAYMLYNAKLSRSNFTFYAVQKAPRTQLSETSKLRVLQHHIYYISKRVEKKHARLEMYIIMRSLWQIRSAAFKKAAYSIICGWNIKL